MINPVLELSNYIRCPVADIVNGMQANIRVLGKNGSTQMLKVWLPGLMQLVGDHAKVAIAESEIASLLDADSGLRIQSTEA